MKTRKPALKRMDNVLIVVDDLEAVKAFFTELGMELKWETTVEGPTVRRRKIGKEDQSGAFQEWVAKWKRGNGYWFFTFSLDYLFRALSEFTPFEAADLITVSENVTYDTIRCHIQCDSTRGVPHLAVQGVRLWKCASAAIPCRHLSDANNIFPMKRDGLTRYGVMTG